MSITFNKDKIIKEHERLVKLLDDTISALIDEYIRQKVELEEYKGGKIDKVHKVMKEFKEGKLKSSSGKKVTNPKQAIAIALSEQRRLK